MKRREFFRFMGMAPLGVIAEIKPDPATCKHEFIASWGDNVWLEYSPNTAHTVLPWPEPVCRHCGYKFQWSQKEPAGAG